MKGRDVIVMRGEGQHLSDARASACLWETGHSGDSCNDGNLKTLHCVCLLSAYYVSDTESMKFNGEVIELIQKCNECTVINYDCSLPGSSVHGIFQAKILEWVAISYSRGSSQPRNRTRVS
ncbi:unnamed protein product [Rangifer tarandus platyrhynchus]|uniref:Uncharacterized protein n=1 Tax=Rangifer tarandus platyrhynchus TaxID=3082113 RepID=A0AC59Y2M9_RANTA